MKTVYIPAGETVKYESLVTENLVVDGCLKVVYGVVTLLIMQCAYFNFKHLIIFDVELGIVRCLRPYNALVLVYAAMSMLEPIGLYLGITPVYLLSCAVTAAIALALLPVVKGGFDKWAI